MILDKENKLLFIDFGLGFISSRIEDKAVDLHLIKQALEAKHYSIWQECWKIIEKNYNSKEKEKTLEQLKKVEARGRYKQGS
jgi:Kae1-associated kinase Bud32